MTKNNGYLDYPTNQPPKDDYYLVLVKQTLILKLGLAPSPSILIARYNRTAQEWTTVLGGTSVGVGDIGNDIISWCSLPKP